jgi:AcrR family transcriptional regulator
MPKIVDHAKNQDLIAKAACSAIAKKGIARFTMRDIASEANVTTGMITNYFGNKYEIVEAALRVPFKNFQRKINLQIVKGNVSLADLLDSMIPATRSNAQSVSAWVSLWGMIATNSEFQKVNEKLHLEALKIYKEALLHAWPESKNWSVDVLEKVVKAILTMLFGLCAGGVTNPTTWTRSVQREQLQLHLQLIRAWANSQ